MWPSIAQNVVELLVPHLGTAVTRVFNKQSPDADSSRSTADQITRDIRDDLGQVTAAHAGIYRQLNEQSDKLSDIGSNTQSLHLRTVAIEDRLISLENRSSLQQKLTLATLILLSACVTILLILLLRRP